MRYGKSLYWFEFTVNVLPAMYLAVFAVIAVNRYIWHWKILLKRGEVFCYI